MIPIPKIHDPVNCQDHRTITLIPLSAKNRLRALNRGLRRKNVVNG